MKQNQTELNYLHIRNLIGICGIALPPVLILVGLIVSHCRHIENSISDYYYTAGGDVFVGILITTGVFLYTYKYNKAHNFVSNIAATCAIITALIPTSSVDIYNGCKIWEVRIQEPWDKLHFIAATTFLLALAYMSAFIFTKPNENEPVDKQQKKRYVVYRLCGLIMLLALVTCGIVFWKFEPTDEIRHHYNIIFWLESICLWAFGISWLIKGRSFMKDKKTTTVNLN